MNSKQIEDEFLTDIVNDKKKSTRKKSKNSKRKGNNNENEMAHILTDRFPKYKFARSVSSGAYTGGMNQYRAESLTEEQKLIFSGDIRIPKNFKFTIEHKAYQKADFWELFSDAPSCDLNQWYEQSATDARNVNKKPMLVVKYNNHKRICFIKVEDAPDSIEPVFIHKGRCCYWLETILSLPNDYFFENY